MRRSVALFDFDNTIAQGDSIKRLLKYDLKKRPWHIFCFIKTHNLSTEGVLFLSYHNQKLTP